MARASARDSDRGPRQADGGNSVRKLENGGTVKIGLEDTLTFTYAQSQSTIIVIANRNQQ